VEPFLLDPIGDLLPVYKPSGVRIHPADDDGVPDLIGWLSAQPGVPAGTVPVHRLDAPTSGIVLCSADPNVRREASGWFADGRVQKRYLALVFGRARKKGIIRRKLQDARRQRPLEAVTRYRLAEALGNNSLLVVTPETGRKHQIRRHLHGIGHSIIGDERYRSRRFKSVPAFPGRLWLHAERLILPDGTLIEAPLPEALENHLDVLRAR